MTGGAYTAKETMGITNEGTVENGSYTAETGAMTITNRGKLSSGTYTAKAGTMGITNQAPSKMAPIPQAARSRIREALTVRQAKQR